MPEPQHTDDEILRLMRAEATHERGFSLLVAQYGERLYGQARRMVGVHGDADDVLQNALIRVFRGLTKFEGKSSLYTWMYRIVTNEAISFLAQRQRKATQPSHVDPDMWAQGLAAEPYLDGQAATAQLQEAVRRLPDKQRLVFELRYFGELSYRDMSSQLGTSEGALKASYHHAVKKIELFLNEQTH